MTSFRRSIARHLIRHLLGGALIALTAGSVSAAELTGQWMVADGNARIKIGPCGDTYWGMIDWAGRPDDVDKHNPDPSKRNRPVIGMPILLGMKPSGQNEWSGEVYNAQNGGTYMAKIRLVDQNVLKITGCVLGGLFCGGENWRRATESQMTLGQGSGPAPTSGQGSATKQVRPQTNAVQSRQRTPNGAAGRAPQPARIGEVCPDGS